MSIINDALKKVQRRNQPDQSNQPNQANQTNQTPEQAPAESKKPVVQPRTVAIGVILFVLGLLAIFVLLRPKKVAPPPQPKKITAPIPEEKLEPAKAEPVPEEEIELPRLEVNGIMYEPGGKSYAVINDKIVEMDDEIKGARISNIEKGLVTVIFKDKEFKLRLGPSKPR